MSQKSCTKRAATAIRAGCENETGNTGNTELLGTKSRSQNSGAKIYYLPGCAPARNTPKFRLHRSYLAVTMDEDGNEFASIAGGYKDDRQLMRALGELLLQKSDEGPVDR